MTDVELPQMITIPAGTVTLTDRRSEQTWNTELAMYEIAATQVTQALFAAVTAERPSTAAGDQLPVETVSWDVAITFCNALSSRAGLVPAYAVQDDGAVAWDVSADGYRLPSEAEWEYACRAGTTEARYGPLDDIAWYRGNSDERSHEVGGKRANPWGLHDTLGNVWEWCWDFYDPEVYGSYRVLRGGGWFDEHWSCRASVRRRSHPTYAIDDVGFRVARTPRPSTTSPPESGGHLRPRG